MRAPAQRGVCIFRVFRRQPSFHDRQSWFSYHPRCADVLRNYEDFLFQPIDTWKLKTICALVCTLYGISPDVADMLGWATTGGGRMGPI